MNRRTYRSVRGQALHYLSRPHREIPAEPIASCAAWRCADLADDAPWSYDFTAADIEELTAALAAAPSEIDSLRAEHVRLPTLSSRIDHWRRAISQGRGFVRLRGIPVDRWCERDVQRCFWALGQHLGRPGAQNGDGELLGHVRDLRLARDGQVRQYKTSEEIRFHCDAADAVGLLCIKRAKSGGRSCIASSVAIFNRILELRPDLVSVLFEPMYYDSRGDGGVDAFVARPCAFYGGQLRTFYHSEYMRTAQRYPNVPPLSREQNELLDLYDELAGSSEFCLEMDFAPGDIQLISNHTIVHARTAYEDHEEPENRRHLLRLWLTLDSMGSLAERAYRARSLSQLIWGLIRRRLQRTGQRMHMPGSER